MIQTKTEAVPSSIKTLEASLVKKFKPLLQKTASMETVNLRQEHPKYSRHRHSGGERGIRTLGGVAPTPDFESGTFVHSVISPHT